MRFGIARRIELWGEDMRGSISSAGISPWSAAPGEDGNPASGNWAKAFCWGEGQKMAKKLPTDSKAG